jgi:beta-mannosidase
MGRNRKTMGDLSGSDHKVQPFTATTLSSGWLFKQTDDISQDAWLPVKTLPSTVHQDLIDNKK